MKQEFNRSVTLVSVSRIHRQALEVASLVILNYHYTRLFKMHAFAYLRYGPKRLFDVISEDNVIFTTVSMSNLSKGECKLLMPPCCSLPLHSQTTQLIPNV